MGDGLKRAAAAARATRTPKTADDRRAEELDQLRARRDRLAHEIEMTKNDAERWNRTHPGEVPFDAEALVAEPKAILAGIDRQLGLGDPS